MVPLVMMVMLLLLQMTTMPTMTMMAMLTLPTHKSSSRPKTQTWSTNLPHLPISTTRMMMLPMRRTMPSDQPSQKQHR